MPKCVPCIGDNVRKAILGAVDSRELYAYLESIPVCDEPDSLEVCFVKSTRRGGGEKREPSEYNKFIGSCMKGKNIKGFGKAAPALRECAAAWKKRKS